MPGTGIHTFYMLGGVGGEVLAKLRWKYYPHVSSEDYAAAWCKRF